MLMLLKNWRSSDICMYYLYIDVILCCYANIKASCLREMPSSIMSLEVTKCDKLVRSILSELGILLSKTLGDSFSSLSPISVSFYPQPLIVIKHKVAQPETTSKLGTVPYKNSESSLSHPETSKLQKSHYYCCVSVCEMCTISNVIIATMVMTHDHQKHHRHFIPTLIVYVVFAQFPR